MEEHDTQLSQAYRDAHHPAPSPALDARILDAARRAVTKPTPPRRPAWFAWAVPFSTVAVLVLGITLLFEIQRQAPEVMESPTAIPPARLDRVPPASMPADAGPTTATGAAKQARPPFEKQGRIRPEEKETVRVPERTAPASDGASDGEAAGGASVPRASPFPGAALQTLPPPPPPAARIEAPPASVPGPAAAQAAAETNASLAGRSADRSASPSEAAAMVPERASAPATGRALETRKAGPVTESPEKMLETIRRLMREGRLDEARRALDTLRRTYPGYVLPEDMQALSTR